MGHKDMMGVGGVKGIMDAKGGVGGCGADVSDDEYI